MDSCAMIIYIKLSPSHTQMAESHFCQLQKVECNRAHPDTSSRIEEGEMSL